MAHSSVASASRRLQQLRFDRDGILPAACRHSDQLQRPDSAASPLCYDGSDWRGGRIDPHMNVTTRQFD